MRALRSLAKQSPVFCQPDYAGDCIPEKKSGQAVPPPPFDGRRYDDEI